MKEIHQEQEGFCGPAVIQDIIHQEGMFATQSEIADVCWTTNQEGTSHIGLLRGARELGLKVFKIVSLPIEEYKDLLKFNHVIVNWMDGDNDNEDGHYSLLEKVENGKVYLHDYTFTIEEFDKKWYDIDRGQRIDRWAMLVHKKSTV